MLLVEQTVGLVVPVEGRSRQLLFELCGVVSAEQQLAADTTSAIPAGAHLSIFAVDTTSAAQLIGTLDP